MMDQHDMVDISKLLSNAGVPQDQHAALISSLIGGRNISITQDPSDGSPMIIRNSSSSSEESTEQVAEGQADQPESSENQADQQESTEIPADQQQSSKEEQFCCHVCEGEALGETDQCCPTSPELLNRASKIFLPRSSATNVTRVQRIGVRAITTMAARSIRSGNLSHGLPRGSFPLFFSQ